MIAAHIMDDTMCIHISFRWSLARAARVRRPPRRHGPPDRSQLRRVFPPINPQPWEPSYPQSPALRALHPRAVSFNGLVADRELACITLTSFAPVSQPHWRRVSYRSASRGAQKRPQAALVGRGREGALSHAALLHLTPRALEALVFS